MGRKRPILKVDMQTLQTVERFESIREAKDALSVRGNSIDLCLKGTAGSAYGYLWVYADKPLKKKQVRRFSREETVELIRRKQSFLSYGQLSDRSGWSVEELIRLYDEEKLYRLQEGEKEEDI